MFVKKRRQSLDEITNMIGGAFSSCFDENDGIINVFSVPFCKWGQQLKSVARGVDVDRESTGVLGRGLIGVLTRVEAIWWKEDSGWWCEFESVDIGYFGVEVESAREGHHGGDIWGGDEGVGVWISVITLRKVSVV